MNDRAHVRPSALFLSHGGGPLPLLGDAAHAQMVSCLHRIATTLPRPSALIVVSAHWEESVPTITSGARPPLIYDYSGFPSESYRIEYPCHGEPSLARRVHDALRAAGLDARLDDERGFDHGMFVPLKIMYPQADIPCVQLSLARDLDPVTHLRIGQALRSLGDDGLLVVGSGLSFHNLRAWFAPPTAESMAMNQAFESWLQQTCSDPALAEDQRMRRLIDWERAPHARYCHPREEHLLPLHVCYGLAGTHCSEVFTAPIMGRQTSMFRWSGS